MTQLLAVRERLKSFYSRYENFCRPVLKCLLAFCALTMINKSIGYSGALTNKAVVLVIALLCSFLPINFIVAVTVAIALLHLYALSLSTVIVTGILFMVMFLMYFRFASKDTVLLLFTPLCFMLKVPYIIPVCAGLISTPAAVVSTGCGVVSYYMLHFIVSNRNTILTMSGEEDLTSILETVRFLFSGIINNKEMIVVIAAFAITIIVVWLLRRLPVDHAWPIAMITGALIDLLVILVGDLKYGLYFSIGSLLLGSIVSLLAALVLQFFVFNVDYSRTEKVQFEDDEYYYFVKAVPKNTVPPAERTVKTIKGQEKEKLPVKRRSEEGRERDREHDAPEYRMRRSAATRESDKQGSYNKTRTKKLIASEDEDYDDEVAEKIERAAAAKLRAQREEKRKQDN